MRPQDAVKRPSPGAADGARLPQLRATHSSAGSATAHAAASQAIPCHAGAANCAASQPRAAASYASGPPMPPSSAPSNRRDCNARMALLSVTASEAHSARIQGGATRSPKEAAR